MQNLEADSAGAGGSVCVACERFVSTPNLYEFTNHEVKREQWIISLARADPVDMAELRRRIERRARPMICTSHFPGVEEFGMDILDVKLRSKGLPIPVNERGYPLPNNVNGKFRHRVPQLLFDAKDPVKRKAIIAMSEFRPETSKGAKAAGQIAEDVPINESPDVESIPAATRTRNHKSLAQPMLNPREGLKRAPKPSKAYSPPPPKRAVAMKKSSSSNTSAKGSVGANDAEARREIKSEPLDEDEMGDDEEKLFRLTDKGNEIVKLEVNENGEEEESGTATAPAVFVHGRTSRNTINIEESNTNLMELDQDSSLRPSSTPPSCSVSPAPILNGADIHMSPYKSALDDIVQTSTTFVIKCPNSLKGLKLKKMLKDLKFAYCQYNDLGEQIDCFTSDFPEDDDAELSLLNTTTTSTTSSYLTSSMKYGSGRPQLKSPFLQSDVASTQPALSTSTLTHKLQHHNASPLRPASQSSNFNTPSSAAHNGKYRVISKPYPTVNLRCRKPVDSTTLNRSTASPSILRKMPVTPLPLHIPGSHLLANLTSSGFLKPSNSRQNDPSAASTSILRQGRNGLVVRGSTGCSVRPYSLNRVVNIRSSIKPSSSANESESSGSVTHSAPSTGQQRRPHFGTSTRFYAVPAPTYEPVINAPLRLKKIQPSRPAPTYKKQLSDLQRPYKYNDEAKTEREKEKERQQSNRDMEKERERVERGRPVKTDDSVEINKKVMAILNKVTANSKA